jgi:hypothetical protein
MPEPTNLELELTSEIDARTLAQDAPEWHDTLLDLSGLWSYGTEGHSPHTATGLYGAETFSA